jgi:hypothetical protein
MNDQFDLFTGHRENLNRVYSRIAAHILAFYNERRGQAFHAEDLRQYVLEREPSIAPGSPDRILREMRLKGVLSYVVINRRASLYQFRNAD